MKTCIHCGEEITPCPTAQNDDMCRGWVHALTGSHLGTNLHIAEPEDSKDE